VFQTQPRDLSRRSGAALGNARSCLERVQKQGVGDRVRVPDLRAIAAARCRCLPCRPRYDVRLMELPSEVVAEAQVLFEDVRLQDVDPVSHADFVIARVLERGTSRSVRALVMCYGESRIRSFFANGGVLQVSRRTAALWLAYFGLSEEECTSRSSPRTRSPFWTD